MMSEKTPGQPSPSHGLRSRSGLSPLTRRSMLCLTGLAVAGATVGAWPRLTGTDIPG
ncbi:ABC transporter substrate-binding protein, partial [Arthrobacter sp. HMWF013]